MQEKTKVNFQTLKKTIASDKMLKTVVYVDSKDLFSNQMMNFLEEI
jgi:ribosomal protein S17